MAGRRIDVPTFRLTQLVKQALCDTTPWTQSLEIYKALTQSCPMLMRKAFEHLEYKPNGVGFSIHKLLHAYWKDCCLDFMAGWMSTVQKLQSASPSLATTHAGELESAKKKVLIIRLLSNLTLLDFQMVKANDKHFPLAMELLSSGQPSELYNQLFLSSNITPSARHIPNSELRRLHLQVCTCRDILRVVFLGTFPEFSSSVGEDGSASPVMEETPQGLEKSQEANASNASETTVKTSGARPPRKRRRRSAPQKRRTGRNFVCPGCGKGYPAKTINDHALKCLGLS